MKILTYEQFIETCRSIIETTGLNTEGKISYEGLQLQIKCGVEDPEDIIISIWLDVDSETGYREPYIEFNASVEYKDSDMSRFSLRIIKTIANAVEELGDELLDCRVDYETAHKIGNFKDYEWKPVKGKG